MANVQRDVQPEDKGEFFARIYEGVSNPKIEFNDDAFRMEIEPSVERSEEEETDDLGKPKLDAEKFSMGISLENIVVEVNNQSFGMISASTGCASNPGGPGC